MRISDGEQEANDFDWFCVDEAGEIAHFTTAGFKRLPHTVANSAENLEVLTQYFVEQIPSRGSHFISSFLDRYVEDWQGEQSEERYLKSFIGMADKGLYSFDIGTYVVPDIEYFLVASPTRPLRFDTLPISIRNVLSQTRLQGKTFREAGRILYRDTLTL